MAQAPIALEICIVQTEKKMVAIPPPKNVQFRLFNTITSPFFGDQ